jgi:hypothetical protein
MTLSEAKRIVAAAKTSAARQQKNFAKVSLKAAK